VFGLALGMVLVAVAAGVLVVGQIVLARQVAGSAADLAALSAGSRLMAGGTEEEACEAARAVSLAHRAELVTCGLEGQDMTVESRSLPPAWVQPLLVASGSPDGAAHAWSRAGPPG